MDTISKTPEQTQKIAGKLAKSVFKEGIKNRAKVLALIGELGVGKTVFTKGFTNALGIKSRITSPTFILMHPYEIKIKSRKRKQDYKRLIHIDCYRLQRHEELYSIGIKEIFSNPENIVLMEWAEKAEEILPKNAIRIYINHVDEKTRAIKIK